MATTNTYRFLKDIFGTGAGLDSYVISGGSTSAATINQGDQMQWDAGSRYATNNALASGAIFLGICEEANPVASLGTASQPLTGGYLRIKSCGIHSFKTTNGDTYSHMDPVYQGADVQTITNGASANRMIGRVHLPNGTQVVGTGSNTVAVNIYGSLTNGSNPPSSASSAR